MIYGHGINDMPKGWTRETDLNWRIYSCWFQMLRRCYSDKDKKRKRNSCYKKCYVCDRWLILSNFVNDLPKIDGYELWLNNPKKHISLDKDIKSNNKNKCYCLEQCIFTTQFTNTSQAMKSRNNEYLKKGNHYNSKKVMAISNDNEKLIFNSLRDASEWIQVHYDTLRCHLNGKCSNYYKGYYWKFMD